MSVVVIALDVGGSSIKSGIVSPQGTLLEGPATTAVDSRGHAAAILDSFAEAARRWLPAVDQAELLGIRVAIPGPFDYEKGISRIRGVAKYEGIYGLDVGQALRERLALPGLSIRFQNDAEAAILGEIFYGAGRGYERVIGVTLGTGLGSAFVVSGSPVREGRGVPPRGWLYRESFAGRTADELFSARGLRNRLAHASGHQAAPPDHAAAARAGDAVLQDAFEAFGHDLGQFLRPYVVNFRADLLLVLGGIAQAYDLFGPALTAEVPIPVRDGDLGTAAALLGVAIGPS